MVFIIKRIIYYPKEPLLKISAPSEYKPNSEKILSKTEIVISDENKAKELVLPGGNKITKEMLDNMEFSSSEESSSSDKDEIVKDESEKNKNDEIEKDENDEKVIEPKEKSDNLENNLIVEFSEKISFKEEKEKVENVLEGFEKLSIKEEKKINVALIEETTTQKVEQQEEKPQKEEKQEKLEEEKPKETLEDKKEILQNTSIPLSALLKKNKKEEKPESQVYTFNLKFSDSLAPKLLMQRIRKEFHCDFLDQKNDILILNNLYKKEFSKKFLNILDDELKQPDLTNKFKNNLIELKQNLGFKPKRPDIDAFYTIDKILSIKERKVINLNIDKKIFNSYQKRSFKEDTVATLRLELNKIAWANANIGIERIKAIKINTDLEMKKFAEIIFEKAITENAFCKLYAYVIQQLFKTFKSEEEKRRLETKSVLFLSLISLIQNNFNKKIKWESEIDLSTVSEYDKQSVLEDENIIREKKKGKMLGTVKFVSFLYQQSVIGFKGILFCFNSLKDLKDEQTVETLAILLKNCSQKIVESDKSMEINNLVDDLRNHNDRNIYSNRIRFLVQDVLENYDSLMAEKRKKSPFKNAFSALQASKSKTPVRTKSFNTLEKVKNKEIIRENKKYDDPVLLEDSIDLIKKTTNEISLVNDYVHLVDELLEKTNNLENKTIFLSLFLIFIENYKTFSLDLEFLKFYLNYPKKIKDLNKEEYFLILDNIKNRMDDITVDCPYAKNNFEFLIFCLNKWRELEYGVGSNENFDKKYNEIFE